MQYKNNIKIIIDKRKLDTLLRLNCPKENIINLILENKLILTGDNLIDDNLESLLEIKEFNNWGGKREGSGRKNHLENHLENQVENHLENQDINQVVDIDKDIDIDIDNINNNNNKELKIKKIDKFLNNPYKKHFEENYKTIFKNKPYLNNSDLNRIIELYSNYSKDEIVISLNKLKNINFEDIDFKPSASWLLKDNNFERIMNGEFDKNNKNIKSVEFKY